MQRNRNFFRKGNLIALRELALRRTADRIGDDVQAYRIEKSIDVVWKTNLALLSLIRPAPSGQHIVRSAARLVMQLNTDWHAIYVETPRLQCLPSAARERILKILNWRSTWTRPRLCCRAMRSMKPSQPMRAAITFRG